MARKRWSEKASATVLALGLGLTAASGFTTIQDYRNLAVAHDLVAHGQRTSAHDAQFWFAMHCRGCTELDRVRAVVEFPRGPERVELVAASPWSDSDYPIEEWIPADTDPYVGQFDVLYDPDDHTRVIAVEDLAVVEEDARIGVAITAGALLLAAVGGLLVWAPWAAPAAGGHAAGRQRRH